MKQVLFLCTGNYYRSRFAEIYFNWLATNRRLDWKAQSRGLALDAANAGPLSHHTAARLRRLGIDDEACRRFPRALAIGDLAAADRVVAVKATEHRPMLEQRFAAWLDRVEFWEVHDVDCAPPEVALPQLEREVMQLVRGLSLAAA